LSGVTITDYGTDTAEIAISGNKITCSVAGKIFYIQLSNGAYLVPVATKFYDVSGNAFAPIGDSLVDFSARSDDALFWCDERGFAVTEENEILPALVAGSGYAPSGYEMVRITATTTGATEDVVLGRITLSETSLIFWGDGDSTALTGNTTYNNLTHNYAVAGSYQVKIAKADKITEISINNSKWSNFTTYDLRNSNINYFNMTATGSGFTVDSSHMTGWTVGNSWFLNSMPAGTYNIDSSHMTGWTVGGSWYLFSMPAGTYNIDSSHMTGWTVGSSWILRSMPAGTYNIDSSHMTGWTVGGSWYLRNMPAGTYTIGTATIRNWTGVDKIELYSLVNTVTEADIIKVIEDIYAGRLTFTHSSAVSLNIAGTNADLTDAGARTKVDHLRAGDDGVNTFRSWTINVNGYPA